MDFVDITGGITLEHGDKAWAIHTVKAWLNGWPVTFMGFTTYPQDVDLEMYEKALPTWEIELRRMDEARYIRKALLTPMGGYCIWGYFKTKKL